MALSVETGQFAANTGSATTTVTVGFQGKAIILWTTGQTADGSDLAANAMLSIGFSDGTNDRYIAWASDDNVGTTNVGRAVGETEALAILSNGTPTVVRTISTVTFTNATTTTITWDGTPAAAYLVGYMQLGGSDITNVKVMSHTLPAATGDQTLTGVGFQPDFGMFLYLGSVQTTGVQANGSIGFASTGNPANKQFTMAWGIDDGVNMTTTIDAVSYTDDDNFVSYITDGAETVDVLATLGTAGNPTGWNSDGMDYNISNAHANARSLQCLFIKGGQWDVGTTDTNTDVTGMSFQPKGIFAASSSATADATVTINTDVEVGAAASTTTEATASAAQADAQINTNVARNSASSSFMSYAFGSATLVLDSLDATGWSFSASGGVFKSPAARMGWFAMGDNAAVFDFRKKSMTVGQSVTRASLY